MRVVRVYRDAAFRELQARLLCYIYNLCRLVYYFICHLFSSQRADLERENEKKKNSVRVGLFEGAHEPAQHAALERCTQLGRDLSFLQRH